MSKVRGQVRESADGLRGRSTDKRKLKEAKDRLAREAADKRKGRPSGGRHGRLG